MKLLNIITIFTCLLASSNAFSAREDQCARISEVHEDLGIPNIFKVRFYAEARIWNPRTLTWERGSLETLARIVTPRNHGFIGPAAMNLFAASVIQKDLLMKAFELKSKGMHVCFHRDTALADSKPEASTVNHNWAP